MKIIKGPSNGIEWSRIESDDDPMESNADEMRIRMDDVMTITYDRSIQRINLT